MKTSWHRLPSPQTPSCDSGADKQQSVNPNLARDSREFKEFGDSWTSESSERTTRPSFSPIPPRCESPSSLSEATDHPYHDQLTPSTSTEGDAELALRLSSPSSIRRSTRLQDKVKPQSTKSLAGPYERKSLTNLNYRQTESTRQSHQASYQSVVPDPSATSTGCPHSSRAYRIALRSRSCLKHRTARSLLCPMAAHVPTRR